MKTSAIFSIVRSGAAGVLFMLLALCTSLPAYSAPSGPWDMAALAMDLAGNGPAGRLPDGGPDQGDDVKFPVFGTNETKDVWTFPEVDAFIDSHLKKGEPLLTIGPMNIEGEKASASLSSTATVATAQLNYTTNAGPWHSRVWQSMPATMNGKTVSANVPVERPLVCYFYVTDQRGLAVSNSHVELQQAKSSTQ